MCVVYNRISIVKLKKKIIIKSIDFYCNYYIFETGFIPKISKHFAII